MSPEPDPGFDPARQLEIIRRALARQSFCVLATASGRNRPHAVGLLYQAVDYTLFFLVGEDTVKVRNIRENPLVAVSVPVRKYPFGPPMAVQFQGEAEILAVDDAQITDLIAAGRLKRITGYGALGKPGICFLRVIPTRRVASYGLGVPLRRLLRDLACGARSVTVP